MTEVAAALGVEDRSILEIAVETSQRLRAKFVPTGVAWMGTLGRVSDLPSDQCYFVEKGRKRGTLLMPAAVKGRLEPRDWRPLIASSLAYQFGSEIRRAFTTSYSLVVALSAIIAAGVPAVFVFVLVRNLDTFSTIFLYTGLLLILIGVVSLLLLRANRLFVLRKLHLKADRLAAEIVGREELVRTLEKIDAMHIQDLEEAKGQKLSFWAREQISSFPGIGERLASLRLLRDSSPERAG